MIELTEKDLKLLAPLLRRLGARASREVDLLSLLRGWGSLVSEVERGYALTGYDYVNNLATRDLLDEVVSAVNAPLRDRITEAVDPLDQRFRLVTREVSKPLRIATPERPRWWWFRVPNDVTGELADDLLAN